MEYCFLQAANYLIPRANAVPNTIANEPLQMIRGSLSVLANLKVIRSRLLLQWMNQLFRDS
jgi:hypothetical protein